MEVLYFIFLTSTGLVSLLSMGKPWLLFLTNRGIKARGWSGSVPHSWNHEFFLHVKEKIDYSSKSCPLFIDLLLWYSQGRGMVAFALLQPSPILKVFPSQQKR